MTVARIPDRRRICRSTSRPRGVALQPSSLARRVRHQLRVRWCATRWSFQLCLQQGACGPCAFKDMGRRMPASQVGQARPVVGGSTGCSSRPLFAVPRLREQGRSAPPASPHTNRVTVAGARRGWINATSRSPRQKPGQTLGKTVLHWEGTWCQQNMATCAKRTLSSELRARSALQAGTRH